jgi:hypothetical protein
MSTSSYARLAAAIFPVIAIFAACPRRRLRSAAFGPAPVGKLGRARCRPRFWPSSAFEYPAGERHQAECSHLASTADWLEADLVLPSRHDYQCRSSSCQERYSE